MRRKAFLRSVIVYFTISFLALFFILLWRTSLLNFGNAYEGTRLEEIESISISQMLLICSYVSTMLALISSTLDIFVIKKAFENRSLGQVFVLGILVQIIALGFIILNANRFIIRVLFGRNAHLSISLSDIPDIWYLSGILLVIVGISRFVLEIDQKLGRGNLWRFATGRFFKPRNERRLFMFIDLKSSTTIAEKIGHFRFSQLIQDCFKDLSVVDRYNAEVYQYVGDEVVLSWEPRKGLVKNNYIKAFFAFKSALRKRKDHYIKEYGIFPEFKAGANLGDCTVTEVGELKREICYHGDTINTTARIEALCNTYDAELLISEFLESETNSLKKYNIQECGCVELKGKVNKVRLFKIAE